MVQPASKRLVTEATITNPASVPGQYLSSTLVPRSLTPTQPVDVDVNEAIAVVGETQTAITTYAGSPNAIVHPSLLFFDEGWNGWRYWMAYTPYNGGDKYL